MRTLSKSIDEHIVLFARKLSIQKEKKKNLIKKINDNLFGYSSGYRSEQAKFRAALYYFFEIEPDRHYNTIYLKEDHRKRKGVQVTHDIPYFISASGTPPTYICNLKDLKYLIDIKPLWIRSVSEGKTETSLEEFTDFF